MKTETFSDGSTIDTDEATGNRTVCGKMAHTEYFKRLRAEQITQTEAAYTVMSFCVNLDGTRKAELIRRVVTDPIKREWCGEYSWEVWTDTEPDKVTLCLNEARARKLYQAAMLHGTNVP